jgi:hypothetical protein
MLTCKEVTHLISESLDRELPLHKRLGVRVHLFLCKFCSRYRRQILFLRKASHDYQLKAEKEEILPFASLPPEARQRIKKDIDSNK